MSFVVRRPTQKGFLIWCLAPMVIILLIIIGCFIFLKPESKRKCPPYGICNMEVLTNNGYFRSHGTGDTLIISIGIEDDEIFCVTDDLNGPDRFISGHLDKFESDSLGRCLGFTFDENVPLFAEKIGIGFESWSVHQISFLYTQDNGKQIQWYCGVVENDSFTRKKLLRCKRDFSIETACYQKRDYSAEGISSGPENTLYWDVNDNMYLHACEVSEDFILPSNPSQTSFGSLHEIGHISFDSVYEKGQTNHWWVYCDHDYIADYISGLRLNLNECQLPPRVTPQIYVDDQPENITVQIKLQPNEVWRGDQAYFLLHCQDGRILRSTCPVPNRRVTGQVTLTCSSFDLMIDVLVKPRSNQTRSNELQSTEPRSP